MRIIGDVHGKIDQYVRICKGAPKSIQVGDLGFRKAYDELEASDLDLKDHRYFGGNHDFYPMMAKSNLEDFGVYEGMFYIRGAESIDYSKRTPGHDLFPAEEQISVYKADWILELFDKVKPSVVLSHDCPQFLLPAHWKMSTTRWILQELFAVHKPDLWVFGHHHKSKRVTEQGCEFVCLAECEFLDIR